MSDPARPRHTPLLRVFLVVAGIGLGLLLVPVLLVAIENWRGHRAWAACQRELAALGEKLDLKDWVPPPVPDEQNFAATPLFAGLDFRPGHGGGHMDWPQDYRQASDKLPIPRQACQARRPDSDPTVRDLSAWQRAFRTVRTGDPDQPIPVSAPSEVSPEVRAALEVLEALKVYEPALNELRQAARRPASRFPIAYSEPNPANILLPHLARLKPICQVLQLRAAAEIVAGQGQAAPEDLLLLWRVADAVKDEPLLISQLVRQACFELGAPVLNEGLAARVWTEPQLKPLQARLAQFDFVAAAQRALRAERAFGVAVLESLGRGRRLPTAQFGVGLAEERAFGAWPGGWLRFEMANYCRTIQTLLLPDSDVQRRRINPALVEQRWAEIEGSRSGPWKTVLQHRIFSRLLLPGLGNVYVRLAHAQTVADQAMIACALERYRLAHGRYPDTLQALVPAYLERVPGDVISGEPMRYRPVGDAGFTLWSLGWNAVDDGGVPSERPGDLQTGDWVWELPPP